MNQIIFEKQKYVTSKLIRELRAANGNIKSAVYSATAKNEEFVCLFFKNGTKKSVCITGVCREHLCGYLLGELNGEI